MTSALDAQKVEALTVAMVVAPGVWSRNRLFDFFSVPGVKHAKERASVLRGILRQLPRAERVAVEPTASGESLVRYRVPSVSLERSALLSRVELACVRVMVARAGGRSLDASAEDHARLDASLALLQGVAPAAAPAV